MKIFTCPACQQTLYFDNFQCTNCGHELAYLPGPGLLTAVEPVAGAPAGTVVARGERHRLCGNRLDHQACNWAIPDGDNNRFCRSCRLNDVIPNLSDAKAREAWLGLERAKRWLLYSLFDLGLPVESGADRSDGKLAFSFKQDEPGMEKVFTGHSDGLITINIAEADTPFREKLKQRLGEGYRTLLGHFRHEIGHYYWDRLVKNSRWSAPFRERFGDPDVDYQDAVQRHYSEGAPADWHSRFVSAYASMHPWEDWAETWAHYLHMVDTLETARSFGLVLRPKPLGGSEVPEVVTRRLDFADFGDLMDAWVPLTLALNSLNRSMGLPDPYPFVVPDPAIQKLRFVHDVIASARRAGR
ncbi:MAG: putative zinc-binding metallopeptidase [Pseudomonadota bacterium]